MYNDPKLTSAARRAGSKSGLVYDELRSAILSLQLEPGARIDKAELCERLGVSRQPVSEALSRLAEERLVSVEPQKGTFVALIRSRDFAEAAFLREALEVETARAIAADIDDDTLARLDLIVDYQVASAAADDFDEFYQLDLRFHATLFARLAFRQVAEVVESARAQTERMRRILLPIPARSPATIAEHRAIVGALALRDAAAAAASMRAHMDSVRRDLNRFAAERPDLFEL